MKYILLFLLFIGMFIFGMNIIRIGLFNLSGKKLKVWLMKLTSSPFKGMMTGTAVTALLQSSSTVMVLTIGLIAAKVLTFPQSIGIILGTNIGTTIKTELITFNLDRYLIPFAFAGLALLLFKNQRARSTGMLLTGISAVFTAMKGFEWLAVPLTQISYINKVLLSLNESIFFGLIAGAVISAIIQSSTAMTGIAMGFLTGGILNIEAGIAIMLGANIGTCITALYAALGSGKEAKLAAFAHVWLNVAGVLLFIPLISPLALYAHYLSPLPELQLAHISVIFNVSTSILVLPFAEQFSKMILFFHDK